MSDTGQQVAPRQVTTEFQAELDAYTPNLMQALPPNVPVEKFKRVLVTAVNMNPDLFYANRRTLFTAAVRCASDGLLPDGREAALVVYKQKVMRRDPDTGIDREVYIDSVQYLPMLAGIRKRMRNSGDVRSAFAEVVYRHDRFRYVLGDHGMIEHEPPPLGEDRGEPVGAYAIIALKSGEVLRDVMGLKEIEAARAQGRSKNSLMWTKFWSEGAKKTVLRRCAKGAPQSAELEALLSRDDEPTLLHGQEERFARLAPPPPEPQRDFTPAPEPPAMTFSIVDHEGEVHDIADPERALEALTAIVREAARLGIGQLTGTWEDNQEVIEALGESFVDTTALIDEYSQLRQTAAEESPRQDPQPAPTPGPAGGELADQNPVIDQDQRAEDGRQEPAASKPAAARFEEFRARRRRTGAPAEA